MAKHLIGAHNVDAHIEIDTKTIVITKDMILSPGAKDLLRNRGIAISYGPRPGTKPPGAQEALQKVALSSQQSTCCRDATKACPSAADCQATGPGSLCRVLVRAEEIMITMGITDKTRREAVCLNIVSQLTPHKGV
ncbi:MAG: hypothetical protein Q8R88_13435 [Desulfoprunum sp.]|nr:hypothetical protein [Desulfoprunum sp.]